MTKKQSMLVPQHLEMHCFIRDNVSLLPKSLGQLPMLSGADAGEKLAEIPLGGKRQATGDQPPSSDEDCM